MLLVLLINVILNMDKIIQLFPSSETHRLKNNLDFEIFILPEMITKYDGYTSNEETVSVKDDTIEHSSNQIEKRSEMVEKTKELYNTQMINELHESSFDWMKDLFGKIS